ncbi:MAG: hypothetical protein HYY43_03115 [Deltaproteobacteria bacterium]|nr:hypothetical protein [Deltaproteobacteria bacterium]
MLLGMIVALPDIIITAIVSPTARPIPKITPARIPERAAGRITLQTVCHSVAPNAREPSL